MSVERLPGPERSPGTPLPGSRRYVQSSRLQLVPEPDRQARVLGVRSSGALVWCCDRCGRPAVGYYVLYKPMYTKGGQWYPTRAWCTFGCGWWSRTGGGIAGSGLTRIPLRVKFTSDKRDYVNSYVPNNGPIRTTKTLTGT